MLSIYDLQNVFHKCNFKTKINLSMVDKKLSIMSVDIKKVKMIEAKYNKYGDIKISDWFFESEQHKKLIVDSIDIGGSLLDILFTGCDLPYCRSTFNQWTEEIEKDFQTLLKLKPETIGYCLGQMRCRDYVCPLVAACSNDHVPSHIVESLLKAGANPNTFVWVNGYPRHIIKDLRKNKYGREKIDILKKYGADPVTPCPETVVDAVFYKGASPD